MKSQNLRYFFVISSFVVLTLIVWLVLSSFIPSTSKSNEDSVTPFLEVSFNTIPVYCILITGKNAERVQYAKKAVENFLSQTYKEKHLIIVNHDLENKVLDDNIDLNNIIEIQINKTDQNLTLGHLRNIGLNLVAHDAYWTTWDDDDWRSQTYLNYMMSFVTARDRNVVAITQRLEYNKNTSSSWIGIKPDGFVFFVAPKDLRVQYLLIETMEDKNILADYAKNYKITLLNNDHKLYVRLVHNTNTSLYVDKNKKYLIQGKTYYEKDTSKEDKKLLEQLLQTYFIT